MNQKNLTKHWSNEVHSIFGSCGHSVLWLSNLKVMYVYPIGKNEQTLNYWYLGNALAALLVCEGGPAHLPEKKFVHAKQKNYINNYFKLICFVTALTWKNCIYIFLKNILFTLTYFDHPNKNLNPFTWDSLRIWVQ